MKRGRRLTSPQPMQRKSTRQMIEFLKKNQERMSIYCLTFGHQYNREWGCCSLCGERMAEIASYAENSPNSQIAAFEVRFLIRNDGKTEVFRTWDEKL